MPAFEESDESRRWEMLKVDGEERRMRDRESPWLIGAGLALAVAIGVFGLWLWSLLLSGCTR